MPDLDQQLRRFADAVLAGVEPVTVDEAAGRHARRRPPLVLVAVGVAAAVALVAAVLVLRRDRGEELNLVGPGGATSWVALLERVPDTPNTRSGHISVTDPERGRLLAGRPPTGPDASDREVMADFEAATGSSTGFGDLLGHPPSEVRAEIGLDLREVDQGVVAGTPPHRFTVLRGRFDPAAVRTAVQTDPYWSSMVQAREHEGVPFWSWGEDYDLNAIFSPIRGPGNSARLALVDDLAVWTAGDPELVATLDAVAGRGPSLADDPAYRAAAEQADRHALVEATIFDATALHEMREQEALPGGDVPEPVPDRAVPLVLLHGSTRVAGANQYVTVLVYPTEDAAEAALPDVRRYEAEVRARGEAQAMTGGEDVPQQDPVFTVDGRVLVVTDGAWLFVL
ncbi:MAG TPA: hypothetical protein VGB14_20560 [Acidimicrobiales bacterium]